MSSPDFNTPPEFLELVRLLGPIGLDPCSNEHSQVKARREYFIADNGLVLPWRGFGLVFMNPPHSMSPNNIEPWMEKLSKEFEHAEPFPDDQFVGLVPSKTDTGWFHGHATKVSRRCFLRGRFRYWLNGAPTEGPGRFAQLVMYVGQNSRKFDEVFGPLGWLA